MKKVDYVKTTKVVNEIVARIAEKTLSNCTTITNRDGYVTVTVNNGYLVNNKTPYACSSENIDLAIDDIYYSLRAKGDHFSQRLGAKFTVACF